MRKLVYNAVHCKKCNSTIESTPERPLIRCKCGNCTADGAHEYRRRLIDSKEEYDDVSVFIGNIVLYEIEPDVVCEATITDGAEIPGFITLCFFTIKPNSRIVSRMTLWKAIVKADKVVKAEHKYGKKTRETDNSFRIYQLGKFTFCSDEYIFISKCHH